MTDIATNNTQQIIDITDQEKEQIVSNRSESKKEMEDKMDIDNANDIQNGEMEDNFPTKTAMNIESTINTRKLRRHKGIEDLSQSDSDDTNKTPLFPVDTELKLDALQRVFEGTHSKFREKKDNDNHNMKQVAEPTEPLYCVCRQTYQEDDFMIMCDLCEEWYHGYCVNIKEDDAEDIEEYDCFLCCGYRMPCKGITYNKLDPRNPVHERFTLAIENRKTLSQQIHIETPSQKECQTKEIQRKPMSKPAPLQIETRNNINLKKQSMKIPLSAPSSSRRALRRPKEAIALSQKRDRKQFEYEQKSHHKTPPTKKRKLAFGSGSGAGPPPLQAVPPLEMPDLNAAPPILPLASPRRGRIQSLKARMSPLQFKYHPEHPFNRPPSSGHAPPPLPRIHNERAQRSGLNSAEWRDRIREFVRRKFGDKIGVIRGNKLENYLFKTYGGGSKVWNGLIMSSVVGFFAIASDKRRSSVHCDGNMYINKMYDFLDKILQFCGVLKIIQIGSIEAKDILYLSDNGIREKIRESDPNYKILCKLAKLLNNDIVLSESIICCAKKWSKSSDRDYVNKMRDLMYNLKKNKKLLNNVIKGELKVFDLVSASAEELANDEIVKQRKEIRENTLKERVLTENLDKLKRDSYHIEKSKILNFEDTKSNKNKYETDYDITTDYNITKPKRKLLINESTDEESTDSDDDLAIATNLKNKEYQKELKKREIGKLLQRASTSPNTSFNIDTDDSLIIINDDDESEEEEGDDDDIHLVKVIGKEEEKEDEDILTDENEHHDDNEEEEEEIIQIKKDKMHLIWKGKINHNEMVQNNENGDLKTFGIKIYQICGEYICNLPGFEIGKSKKNKMLMTGRIKHQELEKYILKQMKNSMKTTLICCKITISKEIIQAQKLIKHLKLKERCARFKIGNKNKKNYFDFYMIPPTKLNKYLNAKFVENNFENKKITNKKMWGLCVIPNSSMKYIRKTQKEEEKEPQKQQETKEKEKEKEIKKSNNVLDDKFFSNLHEITSLLGVDEKNKQQIPSDPRKR